MKGRRVEDLGEERLIIGWNLDRVSVICCRGLDLVTLVGGASPNE